MTVGDLPSISNYVGTSNVYSDLAAQSWAPVMGTITTGGSLASPALQDFQFHAQGTHRPTKAIPVVAVHQEESMAATSRRLVKVIIVDPNDNIPLDQCVLYSGQEKLTDLNDQELFFELEIKELLAKHNANRTKVVDKKVKERTEYLEPAKIRDLKMVVVEVAKF